MPTLATTLRRKAVSISKKTKEPLWKGPTVDGITQSMLQSFLVCRERFRVANILGLGPPEQFNHHLGYGHMWHLCEEHLARNENWEKPLLKYCQDLAKQNRRQSGEIQKWYNVCRRQFPVYVKYWSKNPDVKARTPLMQEYSFRVPYKLPDGDGRVVMLRGKFDSVDIIGKGKTAKIFLQENKTKGSIIEPQLRKQLTFDPQTMFYLIALSIYKESLTDKALKKEWSPPIAGVRYNVIRRPFSGGRGSIKQLGATKNRKAETEQEYYDRLLNDYILPEPDYWFMRWEVTVHDHHIEKFRQEFMDPILSQICDWYEHVSCLDMDPFRLHENGHMVHWRHPYGVYNVINEGGTTDLDEYLNTGSEVGLVRRDRLFTELE